MAFQLKFMQLVSLWLSRAIPPLLPFSFMTCAGKNFFFYHFITSFWYDMIYDMTWYDTIYNMIWHNMVWYMTWYDTIRYDMIWHNMIWYMTSYDMIYMIYDIWCDMIWYICYLQLRWHPVAVVQHTYTHKQYIEQHRNRIRKTAHT